MRKYHWILIAYLAVLASCSSNADEHIGQSKDEIPVLEKIAALPNPGRGLHLESGYFAHNLTNPFGKKEVYPKGFINDRLREYDADSDGIRLSQLYIYLTEYVGKDISEDGLENIQMLFDEAKEKGFKLILRFAYDYDYGVTKVNAEDIKRHLTQLKPIIEGNLGVIFVWQAGFIGTWGEWHSSPITNNQSDVDTIVKTVLDILPKEYEITLRYPTHKQRLGIPDVYTDRIGFANDYFTAGEHPKASGNDFVRGTPEFDYIQQGAYHNIMIGEIPYAEQSEWGLHKVIDVGNTLKILRDHHYSAFDITQNFELNIANWKKYSLSSEMLKTWEILHAPEYFENEKGAQVNRSAYEFIRDHLGYRLYLDLENIKLENSSLGLSFDIPLYNYGFATVMDPVEVYLVLIGKEDNQVVWEEKLEVSPRDWQPFDPEGNGFVPLAHHIRGLSSPRISGKYKVGIWLPDGAASTKYDAKYSIRFANAKTWLETSEGKYGINIIGEVRL